MDRQDIIKVQELYKLCIECRKFYLIKSVSSRQLFCSNKCRYHFNNKKKQLHADKTPSKQIQLDKTLEKAHEREYY